MRESEKAHARRPALAVCCASAALRRSAVQVFFYQPGGCQRCSSCTSAHRDEDFGQTYISHAAFRATHKMVPCKLLAAGETCSGPNCKWAHGEAELGKPLPNSPVYWLTGPRQYFPKRPASDDPNDKSIPRDTSSEWEMGSHWWGWRSHRQQWHWGEGGWSWAKSEWAGAQQGLGIERSGPTRLRIKIIRRRRCRRQRRRRGTRSQAK